ncbi:MAG TPA: FKBP-type peptidyl-prolyl cis-trans isomerase [Desulfoprunum sp.]|nr:FKBP-type peptidyl-prolyl cis-trans isomerase [Desulfoprunum sp.]
MIQPNDTVTLSFTGKLDNGEIFTVVSPDEPLTVTIGNLELPPSVEQALIGMNIGETGTIRVPPDEGFGPRQKELVQVITNRELIDKLKPRPGMVLSLKTEKDGLEHMVPATVIRATDSEVEVDYNHPLAGHHLTYIVTIIDIQH